MSKPGVVVVNVAVTWMSMSANLNMSAAMEGVGAAYPMKDLHGTWVRCPLAGYGSLASPSTYHV